MQEHTDPAFPLVPFTFTSLCECSEVSFDPNNKSLLSNIIIKARVKLHLDCVCFLICENVFFVKTVSGKMKSEHVYVVS